MKKIVLILLLGISLSLPASANASQATDSLKNSIDSVITILKDPKYGDEAQKEAQRQELWKEIQKVFDFEKISELALAKYRKKFTDEQFAKFRELFTYLLSDTYLKRVQEEFKNEDVKYLSETVHPKDKNRILVKTLVYREKAEIPVDYAMWLNNGSWQAYDIKVEGVSLVKNYRTQFQEVLLNQSPDKLIQKLEKKEVKDTEGK